MSKKDKRVKANSRRDFIKKTALGTGAAIGLGAANLASAEEKKSPINNGNYSNQFVKQEFHDAVVVGGGVSGVYAALRLALVDASSKTKEIPLKERRAKPHQVVKQKPRPGSPIAKFLSDTGKEKLDVKLYEYSGRIGGRLLSTPVQGVDKEGNGPLRYAEFGGFRFDRQMKIVWQTAQAFNLKDEPFYFQDINVESCNIVNVRGKIFENDNVGKKAHLCYPNLNDTEKRLLKAGFDLGNYITNLCFQNTLTSATPGMDTSAYPNVAKVWAGKNNGYPSVNVEFKNSLTGAAGPTINIAGNINGWLFSYIRYHYAFNIGDWKTVQSVADEYEASKAKTRVSGRSFYDWSWWALKRHYLTQEACDYLEASSGYNEEGNAGTVETNIDENYYFSVKSDSPGMVGLTDYSDTDPYSPETAWRHITDGYSAIPRELYARLVKETGDQNKSEQVVKTQLIAFKKLELLGNGGQTYQCLFYKRQQGTKLAKSGSAALFEYMEYTKAADGLAEFLKEPGLSSKQRSEIEAKLQELKDVLDNYTVVSCHFLVLAMPRRSLELIDQNNFFFAHAGVQSGLQNSVHNILAMRMFVAYPKPWWIGLDPYKKPPKDNNPLRQSDFYPVGRTRTDLGLRQLYYWCYNKANSPNGYGNYADLDKPAVMLASYVSGDATRYWRALQNGQVYDHLSGSQTTQSHIYNPNAAVDGAGSKSALNIRNPQAGGPRPGSFTMGLEAHKQIVTLHGADYDKTPLPYYVHYEDWSKDPWGAGWHSWRSGFPKSKFVPKIRQPLTDERVYIIGECYSNVQGWVQGALNAAEAMCQCNLGLPWASWLSIDGIWLGQGTDWVTASEQEPDPDPCLPEYGQFVPLVLELPKNQ